MGIRKKNNTYVKKSGHIRKRIPLIIYLIILAFSVAMINNIGGAASYVLFFSVILYLPVSLVYMLYIKGFLKIYQELEVRLLYKNRAERYTLSIENSGPFVMGGIRFMAAYDITSFSDDFITGSFELLPHEKTELHTDVFLRYAGSYEAGVTDIVIQDILGIITIRYHIPAPLRVSVLPAVTDVADKALNRILDELLNGRKTVTKELKEDTLGNDLRAYTAGDPVKQIHWKNYARSGELYIRLPDIPDSQMPAVQLIPEQSGKGIEFIKRRDYFLELCVSAASYFAKRKKPVTFIYGTDENERMLVENYESFQKFYSGLEKRIKNVEKKMYEEHINDSNINDHHMADVYDDALLILREKDNTLCLNKKS